MSYCIHASLISPAMLSDYLYYLSCQARCVQVCCCRVQVFTDPTRTCHKATEFLHMADTLCHLNVLCLDVPVNTSWDAWHVTCPCIVREILHVLGTRDTGYHLHLCVQHPYRQRLSSFQYYEWKSPLKLLSVESVKCRQQRTGYRLDLIVT